MGHKVNLLQFKEIRQVILEDKRQLQTMKVKEKMT